MREQKGFAHFLVLALTVIGIGIGIYLLSHPTVFKPKANETANEVLDYHYLDTSAIAVLQGSYNNQKGLWQNPGSDSWRDPYWWDSANALEAVERSILRTNGQELQDILSTTYNQNINGSSVNPSPNFLNDFNDDEQWWALAWIRAYDITGDVRYLNTAKTIALDVANQWTNSCGGGIKWRKSDEYKAADPNLLFIILTLRLHQRTPGDSQYFGWAQNTWNWFLASKMINGNNHINNGLDKSSCQNDGGVVWSYNMGNAIAAMTEFFRTTGNTNYLKQAEVFADASLSYLVDSNGILQDQCQMDYWIRAGYDSCDKIDAANFKGIFIRNLADLYNINHNQIYYNFLSKNAYLNWTRNRDNNRFGLNWSGPFDKSDVPRQTAASLTFSTLANPYTETMSFIRGAADPSFTHELGSPESSLAWKCNSALCNRIGFMQNGPSIAVKPLSGNHTVRYRLKVNSLSSNSGALATLIISKNSQPIAQKEVFWQDFLEANKAQNFDLEYTNAGNEDQLSFQVKWNNLPAAPELIIEDTSIDGGINLSAANLDHQIGKLNINNHRFASPFFDQASGFLSKGPGIKIVRGNATAQFELKVDNFGLDTSKVATISVVDTDTNQTIATQDIYRNQFPNSLFKTFPLSFNSTGNHYSFEVYYHSVGTAPTLTLRGVYIQTGSQNSTGQISATPNPCTIPAGQSTCTTTVTWSVNRPVGTVKVKVREGDLLMAQAPYGTQTVPWVGLSDSQHLDLYDNDNLIGSLELKSVRSSPSSQPSPTITSILHANPNPCVINSGETCTSTISWNSSFYDLSITIQENPGSTFASGASGSQTAPWIGTSGATFVAYSGGKIVDTLLVKGIQGSEIHNTGILQANPNPCTLTSNAENATCTSTISWNSSYQDLKITIKENPGSSFAIGPSGSQTAPWIRSSGATFQAYSNENLVDSLFVNGTFSPN